MYLKCFKVSLVVLFLMGVVAVNSFAEERDEEIATLKAQVQELLKRIEKLEQEQAKAKEETDKLKAQAPAAPRVDLANTLSKLKIKGRWAAGFYDSGKAGSYPSGSFEAPEAKLQFAFSPDELNNIIMRMNLNNATFNNLDYFYVDSKLSKFLDLPFDLNSRLGRFKIDFGEETWSNNPVESVLASNSASNTSGSDEGLQLSGKIGKEHPLGWAVSLTNGTSGTGSDTSTSKAFAGKLSYNISEPLYISASYYDSGSMKSTNSEMSVAGLATRPSGATNWERKMWELDLRYDFDKGKVGVPAYCDSKAFVRLAYGGFFDDATPSSERDGDYGFVEGTYNFTKKIYGAARYSIVDLDGDTTASLNSITTNKYQRYSLGVGYRWSDATIFKLGYDWNTESEPGVSTQEVSNDLISAIVASQF